MAKSENPPAPRRNLSLPSHRRPTPLCGFAPHADPTACSHSENGSLSVIVVMPVIMIVPMIVVVVMPMVMIA